MIFYNIFISPIELIIDWVFNFFVRELPFLGILGAIVGVSLAINFLALPIYNISDTLQDKERKIQEKLKPGIQRIKAVFFGDERFMILQTFYKENHYHPLLMLKDFNSNSEIKTDTSIMTNADTIFLAADGIIENLENPFLNHKMQQEKHRNFKVHLAKNKKTFNKYILLEKPNFLVKNGFNDFSGWEKIEY